MDLACRVYDELVKFKPSEVNSLFMQVKDILFSISKSNNNNKKRKIEQHLSYAEDKFLEAGLIWLCLK